jgi:hypothetical protein
MLIVVGLELRAFIDHPPTSGVVVVPTDLLLGKFLTLHERVLTILEQLI